MIIIIIIIITITARRTDMGEHGTAKSEGKGDINLTRGQGIGKKKMRLSNFFGSVVIMEFVLE